MANGSSQLNLPDTSIPETARFTANLNQAAATYDLCTATGGGVFIDLQKLALYVATAMVGALTTVSIQTNQTNPTIILSSVEGAVANVIAQKNLVRAIPVVGGLYLASGQKLQYTIVGVTSAGSILATIPYFPVDAGARLV